MLLTCKNFQSTGSLKTFQAAFFYGTFIMKKLLITLTATALLAACSHNPPKPYGKPFPINPQPSITTEKANP
ncbi:hypothetical protein C5A10_04805 [Neisseria gonorrhoeae]